MQMDVSHIPTIKLFLQRKFPDEIATQIIQQIQKGIPSGFDVFGLVEDENELQGILGIHNMFGIVKMIETLNDDSKISRLIDGVVKHRHSQGMNVILENHLLPDHTFEELGFTSLDRHNMTIPSIKIEQMEVPVIGTDYRTITWDDKFNSDVVQLMTNATGGSVDGELFPFLKTTKGCENYIQPILEEINNRDVSLVLLHKNKVIGYSFMVIKSDSVELSIMGVDPKHRGLGLGKYLLIQSLKGAVPIGLDSVVLTVTGNNIPALPLYQKIGFTTFEIEKLYVNFSNQSLRMTMET